MTAPDCGFNRSTQHIMQNAQPVCGSYIERTLVDLLEARAVELAA